MSHGYGRIYQPDARDWALEHFLPAASKPKPKRTAIDYTPGPTLDQGELPECVAFDGRDWLNAEPIVNMGGPQPAELYALCQQVDGMPMPHDGSTVRACAKVFQSLGFISSYAFTQSTRTIQAWMLAGNGPVMLGTDFYYSMEEPDAHGLVNVHGQVAGGHAYLCIGYDRHTGLFHCQNSWGSAWGINGTFYIRSRDLSRLLRAQGEACTAVEVQE